MNKPVLSVICPFFNEEENLKEFCERLFAVLEKLPNPWEVIFVNDGSTDNSEQVLKSTKKRFTLLNLEGNHGLSTGFYAGLQVATGDILATLDTDLQNPPEELPRLLKLMEEKDVDMVTGVRAVRQDSIVRKISSKVANAVRRFFLKDTVQDSGCSLRVFKKNLMECFYPYKNIHRYFPGLTEIAGHKVLQVPVQHDPRKGGKAKYNVGNRLWIGLWDVIAVKWVHHRKIRYKLKE